MYSVTFSNGKEILVKISTPREILDYCVKNHWEWGNPVSIIKINEDKE